MFEDALMESSHRIKTRSRYWSFLAVLINCSVLIALIIWPLLHPDALPVQIMAALLVAPSPPPPAPLAQATQRRPQVRSELLDSQVQAPSNIPKEIKLDNEAASSQPSMVGVIGSDGTADGARSGSLNDLFSDIGTGPAVVKPSTPPKLSISSGVMAGNLLEKTVPQYPAIARAARIQGTVVLQATIAKDGSIQNLRVINGPPMLQQAAIDAVRSWRYKPYLLNGEPVEVETTINVVFNLGN
jgi:periplasmic protein TonB